MMNKYYDDYYRGKITAKSICDAEGMSYNKLSKTINDGGLRTYRQYFKEINTGIGELDNLLGRRYSSMATRCNGRGQAFYNGMEYPTIMEWVDFCHQNKDKLLSMWKRYIESDEDFSYAISIDRIDNDKSYTLDNIQFVTNGYNSWKRSLDRPIRVKKDGDEWRYFMTSEEASRYYGLRRQTIGEVLNKAKYSMSGYVVELSTVDDVLMMSGYVDTKSYYKEVSRT